MGRPLGPGINPIYPNSMVADHALPRPSCPNWATPTQFPSNISFLSTMSEGYYHRLSEIPKKIIILTKSRTKIGKGNNTAGLVLLPRSQCPTAKY